MEKVKKLHYDQNQVYFMHQEKSAYLKKNAIIFLVSSLLSILFLGILFSLKFYFQNKQTADMIINILLIIAIFLILALMTKVAPFKKKETPVFIIIKEKAEFNAYILNNDGEYYFVELKKLDSIYVMQNKKEMKNKMILEQEGYQAEINLTEYSLLKKALKEINIDFNRKKN